MADSGKLIEMVLEDQDLPGWVHEEVRALEQSERSSSDLVAKRLRIIRSSLEPDLAFAPPRCDYVRVTAVGTFWEYNISDDCRLRHHSVWAYRDHLVDTTGEARVPMADMQPGISVPGEHSWLVPAANVRGLSGDKIKSLLQLSHDPPYMALGFSRQLLAGHQIWLRQPNALDAVCGGHAQWMREAVRGERVDKDIPLGALAEVAWLE